MTVSLSGSPLWIMLVLMAAGLGALAAMAGRIRRLSRQRNALLQEKDVAYSFVHDVGEAFAGSEEVDINALLKRVLFYALRTTKAGAGVLYLTDLEGETLRPTALSGVVPPLVGPLGSGFKDAFSKIRYVEQVVRAQTARVGVGLIGEVAASGKSILIEDAERDPRVPRFAEDFLQVHSILLVPMRFHEEVIGVLAVINRVDGVPFSQADMNLLQALADQASVSVHYAKFSAALDEKRRLDYDLNLARRIQTAMLPKEIPEFPGVEMSAFSMPAKQVGGDYYDFVLIDRERVGIAIADVSGKSVAGALVMSICRSVLRIEAATCSNALTLVRRMNRLISVDLSEDMFISLLYMVLNTRTRQLTVVRAGHTCPVVNPGNGGRPMIVESKGMAIGVADPDTFDRVLEEKTVTLGAGDMVVAYTDGITEAMDHAGNEWGILNLVKTVQLTSMEGGGASAARLTQNVQQRLLQFVGDTPQYDDLTMVALRLAGERESEAR